MPREDELLIRLIAGPSRLSDIAMPERSRQRVVASLLEKGYLQRSGEKVSLTKAGKAYAIEQGIMPPSKPYYENIPADATLPAASQDEDTPPWTWLEAFTLSLLIGLMISLTMIVVWKADHWIT